LKRIVQNRASYALKNTQNEMFKVFQKHIGEYYSEKVFKGGTSAIPAMYDRTYKLLNSLIKTEVVQSGWEISCKVQIDEDYLSYTYEKGATGLDVAKWANENLHGGTVKGDIEIWNDAIEELGGKAGILSLLKTNLKKCGVPIIN
jgi:hypothetical protein